MGFPAAATVSPGMPSTITQLSAEALPGPPGEAPNHDGCRPWGARVRVEHLGLNRLPLPSPKRLSQEQSPCQGQHWRRTGNALTARYPPAAPGVRPVGARLASFAPRRRPDYSTQSFAVFLRRVCWICGLRGSRFRHARAHVLLQESFCCRGITLCPKRNHLKHGLVLR